MNKKTLSFLLIVIMVVCFAGMLHYPLQYFFQEEGNETDIDTLRDMRRAALENSAVPDQTEPAGTQMVQTDATSMVSSTSGPVSTGAAVVNSGSISTTSEVTARPEATRQPETEEVTATATERPVETQASVSETEQPAGTAAPLMATEAPLEATEAPLETENSVEATAQPRETSTAAAVSITAAPEQTDRRYRSGEAQPYGSKENVQLDPEQILPQYRQIYEQNNDLVGWLHIPGTMIDYPVLQSEESDYYLRRDFYGEPNDNGQLIMDSACDPWTPSYNLVISGHNMMSGRMFGTLHYYTSESFWKSHKTFTYDSLTREGTYVVFGAFYSADYDVDEEGFRYNADIQYRVDADVWLEDVFENSEYRTGIDVEFGDEILTLTTCIYHRENGRFVVVARRVRDGEVIK